MKVRSSTGLRLGSAVLALMTALPGWGQVEPHAQPQAPTAAQPAAPDWTLDAQGCQLWRRPVPATATVTWSGTCVDGKAQGRGAAQWQFNGSLWSSYEGEMRAGRYDGQGTLISRFGVRYEGGFAEHRYEGQGRLSYPSGAVFAGRFAAGRLEGPCTYDGPEGQRYEGQCAAGRPEGQGTIRFANGDRYEGTVKGGWPAGPGRYVWASGETYEGEFVAGKPATGTWGPTQKLDRYRLYAPVGTICTAMPRPQLPAVPWKGTAIYKLVAAIRDGRVVSMEVTPLRAGIDPLATRAFVSSIETAVRAYVCPGDHVFEQEFMFKAD